MQEYQSTAASNFYEISTSIKNGLDMPCVLAQKHFVFDLFTILNGKTLIPPTR